MRYYIIPIIFTTIACGQDKSDKVVQTIPNSVVDPVEVVNNTCSSVPNVVVYIKECKHGGVTVLTGLDVNGNGVLDDGDASVVSHDACKSKRNKKK